MRKTLVVVAAASLVLLVSGVLVYRGWFAPETSTYVNEPLPNLGQVGGDDSPTQNGTAQPPQPLRGGSFVGADDFHYARGTVRLYEAANGTYVLRFEDYDAREGPDVYLYLTRNASDRTTEQIEGQGLRLRVPGGAEDGRATLRGSFNVPLPAGTDALAYGGVAIWCDQFNHFFGHAPLQPNG